MDNVKESILRVQSFESTPFSSIRNKMVYHCSAKRLLEDIRQRQFEVDPTELIQGSPAGLESINHLTNKSSAAGSVFYPDIESLGNRIDSHIEDLDSSQVAAILGYYSKLKFVRPSLIERLSSKANPMEMPLKLNIRFLSSLGTLQKLYDKSQAASHNVSLFLDDKLPTFSALKHFPLFPAQVEVIKNSLDRIMRANKSAELSEFEVAVVAYSVCQLAPMDTALASKAGDLMSSLLKRSESNFISLINTPAATLLLYSLARLGIKDPRLVGLLAKSSFSFSSDRNIPVEQISMVLYSMARLGVNNPQLIKQIMEQARKPEVRSRLSAWDLSTIVYSISQFQLKGAHELIGDLVLELSRPKRLSTYSEQGLTLLIYSLGQTRSCPHNVINALLDELLNPLRMEELTHKGLCMTVHGLSRLEYAQQRDIGEKYQILLQLLADAVRVRTEAAQKLAPSEIVSLIFGTVLSRSKLTGIHGLVSTLCSKSNGFGAEFLESLTAREISIMVRSLAVLNFRDEGVWRYITDYATALAAGSEIGVELGLYLGISSVKYPCTQSYAERMLPKILQPENLSKMTETELISLASTTSMLHNQDKELDGFLEEIVEPGRIENYTEHQAVSLIKFLVNLRAKDSKIDKPLSNLVKCIKLKDVDGPGLTTCLYCYSKHRRTDPFTQILLKEWLSRTDLASNLSGDYVSMALEALTNLGIKEKRVIEGILIVAASAEKLRSMTERGLVLLLYSLFRQDINEFRLTKLILQELVDRSAFQDITIELLSILLFTLCKMNHHQVEVEEAIWNRLESESFDASTTSSLAAANILQFVSRSQLNPSRYELATKLSLIVCQNDSLTMREMSHLFHSVGRLQLRHPKIVEYLVAATKQRDLNELDVSALSGLIYASAESGATDILHSTALLKNALAEKRLTAYKEGHLCTMAFRIHVFATTDTLDPDIERFLVHLKGRIESGEISAMNFGQLIIGIGKLSEKCQRVLIRSQCQKVLSVMVADQILKRMSNGDLCRIIVSSSECPSACLIIAIKAAAFVLANKCLPTFTQNQISAIKHSISHFEGRLKNLEDSLSNQPLI